MKKNALTSMTRVALSAAALSIISQIAIPSPAGVPMTLQTFSIAFLGFLLLPKLASCSIGLYLLLGAVGVPVFANLKGGLPHLFGLTGGFLWGMPALAFCCGLACECANRYLRLLLPALGLLICHAAGVVQYSLLSDISLWAGFVLVSLPYLVKDFIFVYAAYFICRPIRKQLVKSKLLQ